ncbi:putative odorant receptor 69a [Colletes latitarsis]|uniref:putative odorant receptor 69a n=1 Tax=Colletes latitarsis TaxID=2605962 RepID=UPI004036763C
MHILQGVFMLLSLCGCWRPSSWTSRPKKFLYTTYMVIIFFMAHSFLLFLILDLVFNVDNQEDFSDNFYLTAEVFGVCWKMRSTIMNYENYTKLIDSLQEKPLAPMSIEETMIRKKFDKISDKIAFLVSTSTICVEIYNLTQRDLDSKYIVTVGYTVCVMLQILYYCWNGNEVRLKSLEIPDMIMESDWTSLDNGSRKTFLIIMNRATMPIEFTSAHVATMNLDSFMAIMKTSYSVYNVLKQGHE